MAWLDDLLIGPLRAILNAGVEMTERRGLNFKSGFTLTDNAVDDSVDVEVNTPAATDTVPNDVGTAGSLGAETDFARGDHAHGHGAQPIGDGTNHAVATSSYAGFHSAADKARWDLTLPSDDDPLETGTANAGVSASYARKDHVHDHGTHAGGTLHALATTDDHGFYPKTHFALVDTATDAATASKLVKRDASAYVWANGFTVDESSSTAVIGYEDKASGAACETLYLQGQDAGTGCDNGTAGGSVRVAVGAPKSARIGTDSYGVCIFDLGKVASGHGYQSGAITYNDDEGIGVDTGFYGDSGGSLYFRWAANTTANGRSRNLGFRWQASAEFAFSMGAAGSYFQVDGLATSTLGFRLYGSSTVFQATDSAITLARAATFSSTVAFSSTILSSLSFDASLASVSIAQAQDASAAGGAMSLRAQRGFAGFVGGDLTIGGGAGGTGGTNLAGNTCVELGQTVSSATAEMKWLSNGTRVGGVKVDTAGRLYISNAASISSGGLLLDASSGYVYMRGASSASIEAETDVLLYCTASYGYSKSWKSASGASLAREVYATDTTTDATPKNIGTLAITNDRVFHVTARVTAYKDNTTVASFERKATFRAASGTATRVGSSTSIHAVADAALATASIELAASGGNAVVTCTGVGSTTLRWEVYLEGVVGKG